MTLTSTDDFGFVNTPVNELSRDLEAAQENTELKKEVEELRCKLKQQEENISLYPENIEVADDHSNDNNEEMQLLSRKA